MSNNPDFKYSVICIKYNVGATLKQKYYEIFPARVFKLVIPIHGSNP
jgi:hypothetical protein